MIRIHTIFLIFYSIYCAPQNIKDFRANSLGLNQKEGISEVTLNITGSYRAVAYADVNSDKYVDIIVVSTTTDINGNDIDEIFIYLYNYDSGMFNLQPSNSIVSVNGTILNVIVNDFNNDTRVDFLISYYTKKSKKYSTKLLVQTSDIDFKFEFLDLNMEAITEIESQIFVGDFNGDTIPDIMFYSNGNRYITYKNANSNTFINQTFSNLISPKCNDSLKRNIRPFATPHSSAFLDIDGDCVNDLFLITTENGAKYLEIWRGVVTKSIVNYCFSQELKLDPSIGHFSFADIDRDGLIDLVFPISGDNPSIGIVFNNISLNNDWYNDYCETHLGKESPLNIYRFINTTTNDLINQAIVKLDKYTDYEFIVNDQLKLENILRVGDINSDSYPDLIFSLRSKKNLTSTKLVIFLNSPSGIPAGKGRNFEEKNDHSLDIPNLVYSSFFDLDENGQLDIIAVTQEKNVLSTKGYYNSNTYDAFFLKSIHFLSNGKYFTNCFGTTYRYINTNLDGSRRMDTSVQMPQSTNLQLNLPYSYIGIGRSNNYVENFAIISSTRYKENPNYKVFTPIIPNSQLIISSTPNQENLEWNLDLIVNPISKLSVLIITIVSILVIIFICIIYLHIKEVQEDKENESKPFIFWYK